MSGGSTEWRKKGWRTEEAKFSSWICKTNAQSALWLQASHFSSVDISFLIHKTRKAEVMAKVSGTWDSPWSGHVPGLWLLGQDSCLEHSTVNGDTFTGFSEKSLISNILSPVFLKHNEMLSIQAVTLNQLVTPGSHIKVFHLTQKDP